MSSAVKPVPPGVSYAVFTEKNHKEGEVILFYLPYQGNEKELHLLRDAIRRADTSKMRGDYSEFYLDLDHLVSESAVVEHLRVNTGSSYSMMFNRVDGKLVLPTTLVGTEEPRELANLLDQHFYACRIGDFFVPATPP